MSNENENQIGSGSPLEKIITVESDGKWILLDTKDMPEDEKKEFLEATGKKEIPPYIKAPNFMALGMPDIQLSLSEALRVVETTVKYLNQTKNEGRHEIRTIKDKENQHKLNQIRDELVDCECGNNTVIETYELLCKIMTITIDKLQR